MSEFSLDLNEDQLQMQKWVHDFAENIIRPVAPEYDEREETPWDVIQEAANIGLYSWEAVSSWFADPTGLTMALVSEVRRIYAGPLVVSGSITRGEHILAALAMGGDLAYVGTRFIATREANAVPEYKQQIVDSSASDIVYTPYFSGTHGNYLKPSIRRAGLDPDHLVREPGEQSKMVFTTADGSRSVGAKTWKDIWSAGHGVGSISDVPAVDELVARLRREFESARAQLVREPWLRVTAAASQ